MTTNEQAPKTAPANTAGATNATPEQMKVEKLQAEIKKNWSKLSDADIKLYDKQPDQFFAKVKELYGTSKEDAQKRLTEIKATCGCGSSKAA